MVSFLGEVWFEVLRCKCLRWWLCVLEMEIVDGLYRLGEQSALRVEGNNGVVRVDRHALSFSGLGYLRCTLCLFHG